MRIEITRSPAPESRNLRPEHGVCGCMMGLTALIKRH
jgi:hypothetical protein